MWARWPLPSCKKRILTAGFGTSIAEMKSAVHCFAGLALASVVICLLCRFGRQGGGHCDAVCEECVQEWADCHGDHPPAFHRDFRGL